MSDYKNVFAIVGSASKESLNRKLIDHIATVSPDHVKVDVCDDLDILPHFNPSEAINNPPAPVIDFRKRIQNADGVIICTPEYIFSIPAILKNAIEWCVATTVFSDKPVGLITASSSGVKGHEQLQLIMNTVGAKFTDETTLLIAGAKSRIDVNGDIIDPETKARMLVFLNSFMETLGKS
jgi:NAD(P)H-dependent FMN reductase